MGYLNEVFNKYYSSEDEKQKVNIKNSFKNIIWNSLPYIKLKRHINFTVKNDENMICLFKEYNHIEYEILKSRYNINNLQKEDLIKARINSNYGRYFDKEVYLKKEYYKELHEYKNLYFKYLNGEVDNIKECIEGININIEKLKELSLNNKCDLSWDAYKCFVNECLDKIFNNYKPIDYFVDSGEFIPNGIMNWDEDNYIVGYVNKSLNGYLKNYIKNGKEIRVKKCEKCGELIKATTSNNMYCKECAKKINQEQKNKWKRENWNRKKSH